MKKQRPATDRRTYQPRRATDMGVRNRFIEIGLTLAGSIIASAIVTSWNISARMRDFENGIRGNSDNIGLLGNSISQNRTSISAIENMNSVQNSQIAVGDARWVEVQRRLGNMESQMSELLRRR